MIASETAGCVDCLTAKQRMSIQNHPSGYSAFCFFYVKLAATVQATCYVSTSERVLPYLYMGARQLRCGPVLHFRTTRCTRSICCNRDADLSWTFSKKGCTLQYSLSALIPVWLRASAKALYLVACQVYANHQRSCDGKHRAD